MNNKQIIAFLENAIRESSSYNDDDNIHPAMRTNINGDKLAGQLRSLLIVLKLGEDE